jgi:hypothetical protein
MPFPACAGGQGADGKRAPSCASGSPSSGAPVISPAILATASRKSAFAIQHSSQDHVRHTARSHNFMQYNSENAYSAANHMDYKQFNALGEYRVSMKYYYFE